MLFLVEEELFDKKKTKIEFNFSVTFIICFTRTFIVLFNINESEC